MQHARAAYQDTATWRRGMTTEQAKYDRADAALREVLRRMELLARAASDHAEVLLGPRFMETRGGVELRHLLDRGLLFVLVDRELKRAPPPARLPISAKIGARVSSARADW
jgi:hypothetical protein